MDYTTQHPECREGEIFLGNENYEGFNDCVWKSKRFGKVAYDIEGGIIPNSWGSSLGLTPLRPLFANAEEVADGVAKYTSL